MEGKPFGNSGLTTARKPPRSITLPGASLTVARCTRCEGGAISHASYTFASRSRFMSRSAFAHDCRTVSPVNRTSVIDSSGIASSSDFRA